MDNFRNKTRICQQTSWKRLICPTFLDFMDNSQTYLQKSKSKLPLGDLRLISVLPAPQIRGELNSLGRAKVTDFSPFFGGYRLASGNQTWLETWKIPTIDFDDFPWKKHHRTGGFSVAMFAIGYLATNRTPMRYRYRGLLTSHQPSRFHQGVSIPFCRLCSKGPLQKSSPCHVIIELNLFFRTLW